MSGQIQVLPDDLADQIAAGEVVERPASVVKELLENALDAGARNVTVELEEGGVQLIRVTDDGSGMTKADASLCIQRHATSKLRSREQLFALTTLGFRGEALPSIASVSRFELRTRPRADVAGTRVCIEGGAAPIVDEVGCPAGTSVSVRDLFYNVPARLKFLRAKATESGQVAATCTRIALTHPELQLTLVRDGRVAKKWLRARTLAERVQAAFPGETLTTIEDAVDGMRIEAVLGPPERARSGAAGLHLLLNGRAIKDISFARAAAFAYGSVLPPGRYPIGAIHVHLPPEEVDVNVHPQKNEVRLRDGRRRYDTLTRSLARALGTSAWRGPATRNQDYWSRNLPGAAGVRDRVAETEARLESAVFGQQGSAPSGEDAWGFGPIVTARTAPTSAFDEARGPTPDGGDQPYAHVQTPPSTQRRGEAPLGSTTDTPGYFGGMRVLGQVRRMLLVCEGPDGLHLLDQHAADERVRYARLKRAHAAGQVKSQTLLFPERVECTEQEAALVEEHRDGIAAAGLECRLLGPTTVAVHSVPALLQRAAPDQLLRDVLGELDGQGHRAFGDALDMALATMACHAAIRAGDHLSPAECQALLHSLDEVQDFSGHCPHGRPVAFSIGFADLERRLGR